MSIENRKPQSVLSIIFDFIKTVTLILVIIFGLLLAIGHSDGPPLIQTAYERLTNPGPWLGKAIMIGFSIAFVAGSFIYAKQHPEAGGFAKVLTKGGLHLLAALILLPIVVIMGVLFYSLVFS